MLSHEELVKDLTEAARLGEDLFAVLNTASDHFSDCPICAKNVAKIVHAVLIEVDLKQDFDVDPSDLSQEEIEPLLQFPSFDTRFLSRAASPETPAPRTNRQREEITRTGEKPLADNESPRAPDAQQAAPAGESSLLAAQLSKREMSPKAVDDLMADARALEESGELAKAQSIYESARTRDQLEDTTREDLDAKIRELRQRIRVENRLDHEAEVAQALEKKGEWRKAEDTYRQMAAETSLQRRHEEFSRAAERCQVERELDDLFDSALKAFNSKDLVAAMNRLKRLLRKRPGYVRAGVAAETILAQARKEWESRLEHASARGVHKSRLALGGGLVLVLLLTAAVLNLRAPFLAPAQTSPSVAAPTLIDAGSSSSQPVAPASSILPVQTIEMGTAVAPKTKTPTIIPARSPTNR